MDYKDEWLLLEADDDIDEMEHREPCRRGRRRRFIQRSCDKSEISLCDHNGYDHPSVQTKWYGAGAGFPAQ